jgi:hypothetical protein
MKINLSFERYTENYSVYRFQRGEKIHILYLPKIVTTRKQDFEIITSSHQAPPVPDQSAQIKRLEAELAEYRRRISAIRALA